MIKTKTLWQKTVEGNNNSRLRVRVRVRFLLFCSKLTPQGGSPPPPTPHFKFRTKQGLTVSVSNIRNIAFNRCSKIIRTRNFTHFYHVCYNFWIICGGFWFFSTTFRKKINSRWTFWEGSVLNAGPSEMFLIVNHPKGEHNEWEFER